MKMNLACGWLVTGIAVTILIQGCGGDKGASLNIPAITPLVKAALPMGLKPTGTRNSKFHLKNDSRYVPPAATVNAAAYINNTFQNYFNVSGINVQGYILSQVATVDGRSLLFSGQPIKNHACLSATPGTFTADYSAFITNSATSTPNMLKFTLGQVQCSSAFRGDTHGYSGEVFGTQGNNTSIWVTLTDMAGDNLATGGAFMNYANVANLGSTDVANPEAVDGMAITYQPGSGSPAFFVSRYKAVPTLNKFEMYFASNGTALGGFTATNGNGPATNFGAGFRMVSDGVNIYSDGTLCTDSTRGANCGASSGMGYPYWVPYAACLDATTLQPVDPAATSNCLTLANSFTLDPNATVFTSGSFATFTGTPTTGTTPLTFTSLTGDTHLYDLNVAPAIAPTANALTALNANYAISNASSVAAAY